jgi:acetoin utilization deacetylase AcuC-like enzyme
MLPYPLIYHPGYVLNLGAHVFPAQKYRLIYERMLGSGFCIKEDFQTPEPATDGDVLLVHDAAWVAKLRNETLSDAEILKLEIPCSRAIVEAFWLAAGGTILAARLALESGFAFNLGGGFHHGFRAHGEGFCMINDIAIAIRRLQKDGAIRCAMVVDCDVHHGNGTASVFAGDQSVFTLSIHQFHNYPWDKPPSDLDIHLPDGTGDEEYVARLANGLKVAFSILCPDLILYVAGADPYRDDQLGGLALTLQGLIKRDRLVIGTALQKKIPMAAVLAGGYARNLEDTIGIHANTAMVARDLLKAC